MKVMGIAEGAKRDVNRLAKEEQNSRLALAYLLISKNWTRN